MTVQRIRGRPGLRRLRELVAGGRAPPPDLRPRLPVGLRVPHPASGLEARRPFAGAPITVERARRWGPYRRTPRGWRGRRHRAALRCALPAGDSRAIRAPRRAKTPGSIDTGGPNARCERNDGKRHPCGRLREARTEPGVALAAPPADSVEVVRPCPPRGPARCARARGSAGEGSGAAGRACRLSLPGRRRGAECGERVVTGARSGLRASGGKGIAKKIVSVALVTAW